MRLWGQNRAEVGVKGHRRASLWLVKEEMSQVR